MKARARSAYLKHPHHCPYCETEQIEGGNLNTGDCHVWQEIKCLKCGKEWIDVYSLTDVEESFEEV
jgi:hypothetical protein